MNKECLFFASEASGVSQRATRSSVDVIICRGLSRIFYMTYFSAGLCVFAGLNWKNRRKKKSEALTHRQKYLQNCKLT